MDFDVKITGSGLTFLFWMNVEATDVAKANVTGISGLKIADYSYSNGVLTIKANKITGLILSAGDIVIESVIKGGKASQTIALQDAEESGGRKYQ